MSKKTTRVWVPHTSVAMPGCKLAGDLEQVDLDVPTHGRKLALILHGTMGHKDYLFQKKLAKSLPIDSFRFDFRGNHESSGQWKMGSFTEDVEDIQIVVQYLMKNYGYIIDLIIGHSKGSVAGLRWVCTAPEAASVRGYVNVSGRYRMELTPYRNSPFTEMFNSKGYYDWKLNVARKEVVGRIRPEDVAEFMSWDTSIVWDHFPPEVHVLTIQGLSDATVPPFDAIIYSRALGGRSPGTHNLHIMEGADHNMSGRTEEVVSTVLEWYSTLDDGRNSLSTGLWNTGVRGKL